MMWKSPSTPERREERREEREEREERREKREERRENRIDLLHRLCITGIEFMEKFNGKKFICAGKLICISYGLVSLSRHM